MDVELRDNNSKYSDGSPSQSEKADDTGSEGTHSVSLKRFVQSPESQIQLQRLRTNDSTDLDSLTMPMPILHKSPTWTMSNELDTLEATTMSLHVLRVEGLAKSVKQVVLKFKYFGQSIKSPLFKVKKGVEVAHTFEFKFNKQEAKDAKDGRLPNLSEQQVKLKLEVAP